MAKRPNGQGLLVVVLRVIVPVVEVAEDVEEMVEDQEQTTTNVDSN